MRRIPYFVPIILSLLALPALASDRFKVGVVLPFSGTSAEYGAYIREGFELAHAGSARKDKVELIFEDDECTGAKGVAATIKLIESAGIDLLFGGFCSSVVMAQAPLVQSAGIVQMANAIAPQIRDAGEWTYRINPDGSAYLEALVSYLLREHKSVKSFAVLHVENDFGKSQAELFAKRIAQGGAKVMHAEEYVPGTTDFRAQILRIKTAHPQAVFVLGYAESTDVIRQMIEAKLNVLIAASTPFDNPTLWQILQHIPSAIFFPSSYDPESHSESMKQFQEEYGARYSRAPTQYAMMGYEAYTIFDTLLGECGHDRRCMKEFLDKNSFQGVQGDLRFDRFGDAIRPIFIKKLEAGAAQVVSQR